MTAQIRRSDATKTLALAAFVLAAAAPGARGQTFDLSWYTVDGGGGVSTGAGFEVSGAIGQPDAGTLSGGSLTCAGGFWGGGGPAPCYANCDGSTITPILNVNDFICFQTKYAQADTYANCDGSTIPPVLNVNDFICFQTKYAQACP